jgi:hypothetical protein
VARRASHWPIVFGAGLVLALLAGFGIGKAVPNGPAATSSPAAIPSHQHTALSAADSAGTTLSAAGYTLAPSTTAFQAAVAQSFTFKILGPDLKPVTDFVTVQDKKLHLIVVNRDLSGYQHLHPAMSAAGEWSMPLTLPGAGVWHAYADFTVVSGGQEVNVTLGADLTVPGDFHVEPLSAAAREATVDGFVVAYEGTPRIGATQPLTLRVYRNGSPVTELEPYLGTYGHLVMLRENDLAYTHVHAENELTGGAVKFWLAAAGSGRYRMYFQFQVAGTVHTAAFTVAV